MAGVRPLTEPTVTDTKGRILAAAARLVETGGVAAVTTRAVAVAAAVQPPTIYRLFGDKRGLLDAVAEHGMAAYVAAKSEEDARTDPVTAMRNGFDAHVAFGIANPAVFAIMNDVGRQGTPSPATLAGLAVLRGRVNRIARSGRLRVPEGRAVALIEAVGNGTVATLLAMPPGARDPELAACARDAVMDSIVTGGAETPSGPSALAIGLSSLVDELAVLSPGERLLLRELLERIASSRATTSR